MLTFNIGYDEENVDMLCKVNKCHLLDNSCVPKEEMLNERSFKLNELDSFFQSPTKKQMFRKKFADLESLKKELSARDMLSYSYVTNVLNVDYSQRIIEFQGIHNVSLEDFVYIYNKYRLPETILIKIVNNLRDAIKFLNNKGVIHLDLKPSNILVSEDFKVYINDFEYSASLVNLDYNNLKEQGNFLYSAPERVGNNYGIESNIFSLGLLIYYVIHGKRPYAGLSTNEIIRWKKEWKIDYSPILHPLLFFLIHNCINPDPQQRFIFCYTLKAKSSPKFFYFTSSDSDIVHSIFLMYGQYYLIEKASDPRQQFMNIVYTFITGPHIEFISRTVLYLKKLHDTKWFDYIIFDDYFMDELNLGYYNPTFFKNFAVDSNDLSANLIKRDLQYYMIYFCENDDILNNLDLMGTIPQFRSYQMMFGKGVALDIIEGTFQCLSNFNDYSIESQYYYVVIQPLIIANFSDAPEYLCLDLKHITDILGVENIFDFVAYDLDVLVDYYITMIYSGMPKYKTRFIIAINTGKLLNRRIEQYIKKLEKYFYLPNYNTFLQALAMKNPILESYCILYKAFFSETHEPNLFLYS